VREGHEKTAAEALDYVEEAAGRFVVHFEMDVTDFVDLPVADVPRINAGLTFGEALACLGTFASSPKFAGLVVTEFNPDRADEAYETAAVIIQGLVDAVAGKKPGSSGSAPHVPRRSRRTDR
jgi:arginase family enzyme